MKNYLNYINEYYDVNYGNDYPHLINKVFKKNEYAAAMKKLDINDAVDYCINNCKEFLSNPKRISRSISTFESYFYSKPIVRQSRDNANHYTLLLDNSPYWKGYPKRSKSFICAGGLGGKYLVIPKDNSKWGICSSQDIYFSFKNSDISSINRFFVELYYLSKYLSKYLFNMVISDENYEQMKQDINLFQEKLYEMTFQDVQKIIDEQNVFYMDKSTSFLSFLKNNWGKNLFDALIETITPVANDFELKSYKDLNSDDHYKEMWTDSTCLFIKKDYMEEFFELLMEKTGKDFSDFYF